MEHTVLSGEKRTLSGEALDIWHAEFPVLASGLAGFRALLSADELDRANRFIRVEEMRLFVMGRGLLRLLLGEYLHVDPAGIRFVYTAAGKPSVDAPIQFNLSHSGERLLFGFTRDRSVGMDVQRIDRELAWEEFADQVFAAGEDTPFRHEAPEARRRAFFRCWTMKEALTKAEGSGLALPFSAFSILDRKAAAAGPSTLGELDGGRDYVAAWAVRGREAPRICERSLGMETAKRSRS